MVINFECQKCGTLFDCDIGTVTFPENSDKPDFEKEIICPKCGKLSMGEVLLTEIGQSQLTEVTLGFDAEDIFEFEDDGLNGLAIMKVSAKGVISLLYLMILVYTRGVLESWNEICFDNEIGTILPLPAESRLKNVKRCAMK